jgi:hypothetical protein
MKKFLFSLFLVYLLTPEQVYSQHDSVDFSYSLDHKQVEQLRLFESDEVLDITLKLDISTFKKKKPDVDYLDAVLSYYTEATDSVESKIKLRARGNFRKNLCDFPPVSLNFSKNDSSGGEFSGINKMKLVTYCKRGYQEYVLRECLVYKLYNILTDNSFKVRLLRITYINTAKDGKPLTEFGFVIEPIESLENRTKTVEIKNVYLTQKNVDNAVMNRMAIFNYMVGNTDWSVPIRHNVLLMSSPESKNRDRAIAVPFDFDFSGIVGSDYASPFEGLGIETIKDRRYLGVCRTREEYVASLVEFKEKEEEFYKTINEFPYLSPKSKKEMIIYLKSFFVKIDKRNTIADYLMNDCLDF